LAAMSACAGGLAASPNNKTAAPIAANFFPSMHSSFLSEGPLDRIRSSTIGCAESIALFEHDSRPLQIICPGYLSVLITEFR
jgi:hypothetical protein